MFISFHQLRRLGMLVILVVSVVAISGGDAIAQEIPAGYDNFFILPTSAVDLAVSPIPADFFGPGSDPFAGTVCLDGDTIVERITDGTLSGNPPETTIPIELVSLNLTSCEPVSISFHGGNNFELWDLSIELPGPSLESPPELPAFPLAGGMLTATKTHDNGGTYVSTLHVQPIYVFTKTDNPQDVRVLSYYWENIPPFYLTSAGDSWSDQNPDGIPPNTSNFYPGGTPGDTSIAPHIIGLSGGPLQLDLVLVPEPATMSLLVIGSLAMLRRKRR